MVSTGIGTEMKIAGSSLDQPPKGGEMRVILITEVREGEQLLHRGSRKKSGGCKLRQEGELFGATKRIVQQVRDLKNQCRRENGPRRGYCQIE